MAKHGGTGSSVKNVIKTVVEVIVLVVVLAALYPTLTGTIENATGLPGPVATFFGLLPLLIGIFAGYKMIEKSLSY